MLAGRGTSGTRALLRLERTEFVVSLEGGRGRGGEGSPPSHFGDIFFKHFCCAILDYVTT